MVSMGLGLGLIFAVFFVVGIHGSSEMTGGDAAGFQEMVFSKQNYTAFARKLLTMTMADDNGGDDGNPLNRCLQHPPELWVVQLCSTNQPSTVQANLCYDDCLVNNNRKALGPRQKPFFPNMLIASATLFQYPLLLVADGLCYQM
ncbi:hypothetical protein LOK49_LG09G00064 [Camellia lanceoleosa]|uniref:Uncharacterized protein n=1 Tax=Camellia lanceoleosa TaxID=1840588 RepID=A0ACC0GNG0_9ERIC|nr:hypothetical protein LOK49_LG09G00064 [Camellia lanceoleosa]